MSGRLALTPSQIPEGQYALAVCEACGEHRYVTRALMIEKAGDVPLASIEPRLRCIARPALNKRGPACGGRMILSIDAPIGPCLPASHPDA